MKMTEDQACAWSDYRADYGVLADPVERQKEHQAFLKGWESQEAGEAFSDRSRSPERSERRAFGAGWWASKGTKVSSRGPLR